MSGTQARIWKALAIGGGPIRIVVAVLAIAPKDGWHFFGWAMLLGGGLMLTGRRGTTPEPCGR